jgi:hypothetical protein
VNVRSRYASHYLSKLRLLYGTLSAPSSRGSSDYSSGKNLLSWAFPSTSGTADSALVFSIARTIQIINFTDYNSSTHPSLSSLNSFSSLNSTDFMKVFMKKLHYLLPITATAYHLTNHKSWSQFFSSSSAGNHNPIEPFFQRVSELINVEPSPADSRGRKHFKVDPSTRVERIPIASSSYHTGLYKMEKDFYYRRLGDPRLTFLQYDYDFHLFTRRMKDFQNYVPLPLPSALGSSMTRDSISSKFPLEEENKILWELLSEAVSVSLPFFSDQFY